jgi:hypothetical protein
MYSLLQGPPTSQKNIIEKTTQKINQQNVNITWTAAMLTVKNDPAQNFLKHCSS